MTKITELFKSAKARLSIMMTLAVCAMVGMACATGGGETPPADTTATMDTIMTSTITELTTVQQALLDLISQILPVALVVMGSVLVVTLGIRLFRRFTSA